MSPELLLGALAIVAPVATYILGTRRGERLAQQRRGQALASKAADEYVAMARRNYDSGPHALATLGLDLLDSDKLIREAIREMEIRSGRDPWGREASYVADSDLVEFFRFVREERVDFFKKTVEEVAKTVRDKSKNR